MRKGDFTTLGVTAHSDEEREENDFYATDPKALELFLDPSIKEYNKDSRGLNRRRSFENSKIELDKCILVCANCHREIHYKDNNYE